MIISYVEKMFQLRIYQFLLEFGAWHRIFCIIYNKFFVSFQPYRNRHAVIRTVDEDYLTW